MEITERESTGSETATGMRKLLFGQHPKRTIIRVIVLVVATLVTFKFVLLPIRVSGVSMFPAHKDGQILMVYRLAFARKDPQRLDVVAIKVPRYNVVLLKRIIGLPGETVSIHSGFVFINGKELQEDYVKARLPWNENATELGKDEYLVIGDNRAMSQVDHDHGVCLRTEILGKVIF